METGDPPFVPFDDPIAAIISAPDDGALFIVPVSSLWLPAIQNCIEALTVPMTWHGTPADIETAITQAERLVTIFNLSDVEIPPVNIIPLIVVNNGDVVTVNNEVVIL